MKINRYQEIRYLLFLLVIVLVFVLLIGTLGFHYIADLNWVDSFYSAAMFHSGLGPVFEMKTNGQKIFAAIYAIVAAVIFLSLIIYFISKILLLENI